jgi:hypothetical protein
LSILKFEISGPLDVEVLEPEGFVGRGGFEPEGFVGRGDIETEERAYDLGWFLIYYRSAI